MAYRLKKYTFSLILGICLVWSTTILADDNAEIFSQINVDFELLDRDGKLVRDEDFRGKYILLAFGFTHCADVCPMMAANIATALKLSSQDAVGIFISVDTERDTPEITDKYAGGFHLKMMGLGGTHEQVTTVANNFKASFAVTKTQKHYTVQHTSHIYLIGPRGDLLDIFALNTSPAKMAAAMQ